MNFQNPYHQMASEGTLGMNREQRVKVDFPEPFKELFTPSRFKAFYGGRGSAKSHSFARALIIKGANKPLRILCAREIQRSIRDSVKRLLDDVIAEMQLTNKEGTPFYSSVDMEIRGVNGTLFTFAGLKTNPDQIKSTEGLDIAWVAEANRISQRSLELLIQNLRNDDSELWFEWNPEFEKDPVDDMFRGNGRENMKLKEKGRWTPPPRSIVKKVNYTENPFFPEVLKVDMEWDQRRDPQKYAHIWQGDYRKHSDAAVFTNWKVESFDDPPPGTHLHFGGDWGFASDPSCLVRSWIKDRTLYVDHEAWGIGVEIDYLPALFAGSDWQDPPRWENPNTRKYKGIPGAMEWPIRADSARPDTISYMRRRGSSIMAATKGPKSIEEAVEFLKSMDIIVHPRCRHVIDELSLYSYKIDKQTDEVLPILEDKKNHTIDSLRYSHEDSRRQRLGSRVVKGGY